jgi:hypothetical protein
MCSTSVVAPASTWSTSPTLGDRVEDPIDPMPDARHLDGHRSKASGNAATTQAEQ